MVKSHALYLLELERHTYYVPHRGGVVVAGHDTGVRARVAVVRRAQCALDDSSTGDGIHDVCPVVEVAKDTGVVAERFEDVVAVVELA